MSRNVFSIMRILMKQGFSNESLRDILHFFMDENVPLAYDLAWYDALTDNAEYIEKKQNKDKTSIIVIQKVV